MLYHDQWDGNIQDSYNNYIDLTVGFVTSDIFHSAWRHNGSNKVPNQRIRSDVWRTVCCDQIDVLTMSAFKFESVWNSFLSHYRHDDNNVYNS